MLDQITVFVLTYNEQENIARVLGKLAGFARVIVLDSFSQDATATEAARFPYAQWVQRRFDNHANQCNFVLDELAISTPWVMSLDADYVLSDALIAELSALNLPTGIHGVECAFRFCIDGQPLRGSLYPPRMVLFRHGKARYYQSGHTQRLALEGQSTRLKGLIDHDDRKSWAFFLSNQRKYGRLEAEHLYQQPFRALPLTAKVRKFGLIAPWLVPLLCLTWKGLAFEGTAGWKYTQMRLVGESQIALALWRKRWQAWFGA